MSERKSFLLRVDRELLDAVQRWAGDDLRSLNGQIEFLLRRALSQSGRRRQIPGPAGDVSSDAANDVPSAANTESQDERPFGVDATGEP